MTCPCDQPVNPYPRCCKGEKQTLPKGTVSMCDACDPCNECVSTVKLCAFVVPTLEEGRYFKNSFVFVQEDDSTYYIDENRSEIPFGSRPFFINNFDPATTELSIKNNVVYDLEGAAAYVYGDGEYMTIPLTASPITAILAGEGVKVEVNGSEYTVSADTELLAKAEDLATTQTLVAHHTTQIADLTTTTNTLTTGVSEAKEDATKAVDTADEANEVATKARTEAATAISTANTAAADATTALNTAKEAKTSVAEVAGTIYPVGSVYVSTSTTVPSIGGFTWTALGSAVVGTATLYYYERTA